MNTEIEYIDIKTFCSKHRYPITLLLLEAAEKDVMAKCRLEKVRIKINNQLGTGRVVRMFPRWVLEEYFQLWIK